MNWLNIHTAVLDSPEFIGSEPTERATWLCLLRYCAGQENGGRLAGCRAWKDRQWQQLIRVTQQEAFAECELWQWEGDDLTVVHYPADKESEIKTKREVASVNGKKGGRPPKEAGEKPTSVNSEKPTSVNSAKAEGERKGKERKEKGKGMEGEWEAAPAGGNPDRFSVNGKTNLGEWLAYASTLTPPFPECEAERAWNYYESNGWLVGKSKAPSKDWQACCRTCHGRWKTESANAINGKTHERFDPLF